MRGDTEMARIPPVIVRLDRVPEGHLASVVAGQFAVAKDEDAAARAVERAAYHIGQTPDITPAPSPGREG